MNKTEEQYMRRAIELALKGEGYVNPNPMVGAVIVKEGRVIGEGYHHRYGDLHAERDAIASLKEDPAGAEIYVTFFKGCDLIAGLILHFQKVCVVMEKIRYLTKSYFFLHLLVLKG